MAEKELAVAGEQITEKQKKQAAYALNMCVVSVSQIIDYDDLNVLEQEYDGILNNLNLEEMPKDEALLQVLKQILDTISYFRIADKERAMLEWEYQQKIKDAIWDAVPTVGLISTGGTPLSMAVSLASQVGIGYMNYRRSKAKILMEKEKNEWRLQRTAMEQFHGLRRELFDTAWRLADRYQFPDEYRITERQITEYNNILLDEDKLRRYERLDYVKDKFEAYPPFWYHLGSAANAIAQDKAYSETVRARYRKYAEENFLHYLDGTEHNLLREDQLLASCALEYFELKLPERQETKEGRKELEKLIDRALDAAGNQYDVLELCAFSYLQIGGWEKGARILRMLVNQSYNKTVNAQFLSSLYVSNYIEAKDESARENIRMDYVTLGTRLGPAGGRFLFPLPEPNEEQDKEALGKAFSMAQNSLLQQKALFMMKSLIERYSIRYNRAIPAADLRDDHEDAYYFDALWDVRLDEVLKLKQRGGDHWAEFLQGMKPYAETLFQMLNDLQDTLLKIPKVDRHLLYEKLSVPFQEHSELFLRTLNPEQLTEDDFKELLAPSTFRTVAGDALTYAAATLLELVRCAGSMGEIAHAESVIQEICSRENLPLPEVVLRDYVKEVNAESRELCRLGWDLLGDSGQRLQKRQEKREEMMERLKKSRDGLFVSDGKKQMVEFLLSGEDKFKTYADKNIVLFKRVPGEVLAVIDDTAIMSGDILFTTEGVILYQEEDILSSAKSYTVPYHQVRQGKRGVLLLGGREYKDPQVDMDTLHKLIQDLSQIRDRYRSERGKAIAGSEMRGLKEVRTWDDVLSLSTPLAEKPAITPTATLAEKELPEGALLDEDAAMDLSLELKRMTAEATRAVQTTVMTAGATGLIPIPFADAPLLIAQQVALMMKISKIFDLDVQEDGLKTLATTVLGVGGATIAGKTIATGLVKMIPIVGLFAGGAISAGTAGVVTAALGYAFIEVCKSIRLGKISVEELMSPEGKNILAKALQDQSAAKEQPAVKSQPATEVREETTYEYADILSAYARVYALLILAGNENTMGEKKKRLLAKFRQNLAENYKAPERALQEFDVFVAGMKREKLEGSRDIVWHEIKKVFSEELLRALDDELRAPFMRNFFLILPEDNNFSNVQRELIKGLTKCLNVSLKDVLLESQDVWARARTKAPQTDKAMAEVNRLLTNEQECLTRRWNVFVGMQDGSVADKEGPGFDVILAGFDAATESKVLKAVSDITGLSLVEAKAVVEGAPKTIREGVSRGEAEKLRMQLMAAGGKVDIMPA